MYNQREIGNFKSQKRIVKATVVVSRKANCNFFIFMVRWEIRKTALQIGYVNFTKIYNDQVRQYGRTREAVMETIRICKDRNVLAEFFSEREKEVVDIMMTLFNEEYILKTYVESEKQEAAEKTKIGTAQRLYEMGISLQDIAKACQVTVETVEQWLGFVKV